MNTKYVIEYFIYFDKLSMYVLIRFSNYSQYINLTKSTVRKTFNNIDKISKCQCQTI